eukprot:NODE_46_length_32145_cov_0.918711.p19 type:complete len:228 gc:universal NODE_46_length_32145_cov_0.918711:5556-6239(+)
MLSFGSIQRSENIAVIIHGGAWRTGEPAEYQEAGKIIDGKFGNCLIPVYSLCVNNTKWGVQLQDLVDFLHNLHVKYGKSITIFGHSCGAQLALCLLAMQKGKIINDFYGKPIDYRDYHISHIYCLEGIYDIPDLLLEYPTYSDFIEQCFGVESELYKQVSPTYFTEYFDNNEVLIVHSKNDDLLSGRQPREFALKMKSQVCWISGKHWKCLESREFIDLVYNHKINM